MLLHTTETVPGRTISESLGVVSVHLWGPHNDFFDILQDELCQKATALGADAVVAVRVTFAGPSSGHRAGVGKNALAVLSGTAVRFS